MYKISVLFLVIALCQTFSAELVFQRPTSFIYRHQLFHQNTNGVKFSHSNTQYTGLDFPVDQGGNWGDLIHQRRMPNDTLLVRELVINEDIFSTDTEFRYNNQLDNTNITTVRAINLGRERALVAVIVSSDRGLIFVDGFIKQNQQIRLLIEAYGKPADD